MTEGRDSPETTGTTGAADAAPEFVTIAEIVGVFGLKGEVKANLHTDFPNRFKKLKRVWIDGQPRELVSSRFHKGQVLLKLADVDSANDAEQLRGKLVEVPVSEAVKLPRGRYYIFQIVGLDVFTTEEEHLGKVVDVLTTGSNDVYIVRGESGEILLPAIKQVIKKVDLDARRMTVQLLPGLR